MTPRRNWRKALLSLAVIPLVMLLCISGTVLGLDSLCYSTTSRLLPAYPGAEVVLERYNFLRAFGIGETIMVLETGDDLEIVREWQARQYASVARAAAQGTGRIAFNMTDANYEVTALEDRPGSQITLSSVCAA